MQSSSYRLVHTSEHAEDLKAGGDIALVCKWNSYFLSYTLIWWLSAALDFVVLACEWKLTGDFFNVVLFFIITSKFPLVGKKKEAIWCLNI